MSVTQIFDNRTDPVKPGNGKVNQTNDRIIVARNGKEFGPYTYDVAMRYLHAGSLVHGDTARLEADNSWRDLASILGVLPLPPKTVLARSEARLANLALLFGILSWTIILFFLAIPAVIFGHKALAEAKRRPNKLVRDRAIAGLVLGYALIVLLSLPFIFNKQITKSNALNDLEKHSELLPATAVLVSNVHIFHWWNQKTLWKGTEVTVVSIERARNQLQIRYEDQPFSVSLDATDVIDRITENGEKLKKEQKDREKAARFEAAAATSPARGDTRAGAISMLASWFEGKPPHDVIGDAAARRLLVPGVKYTGYKVTNNYTRHIQDEIYHVYDLDVSYDPIPGAWGPKESGTKEKTIAFVKRGNSWYWHDWSEPGMYDEGTVDIRSW